MQNAEDDEILKREREITATREARPCNKFGALSRAIQLCDICGWDEKAHIDAAHELAIEMDLERE